MSSPFHPATPFSGDDSREFNEPPEPERELMPSNEALCPDCGRVGHVEGFGGWWFWCPPCQRRWGHPQSYTLDTAHDACDRAHELTPEQSAAALEKFLREKQARIEAITRAQAREDQDVPL